MIRRAPLRSTTPLRRGGPLKRGKPLAQTSGLARRTPLTSRPPAGTPTTPRPRRRDTGPDAATTSLLWDRAGGRCERCGRDLVGQPASRHHRQPRGMGGSTRGDVNALPNLLLLCGTGTTGCHGEVEANRAQSNTYGWLVPIGYQPAEVPVLLSIAVSRLGVAYLTADGEYAPGAP